MSPTRVPSLAAATASATATSFASLQDSGAALVLCLVQAQREHRGLALRLGAEHDDDVALLDLGDTELVLPR